MKKTILIYGVFLAVLLTVLRILEYRYFVRDLAVEIYISLVAILFTAFGIWLGLKLINRRSTIVNQSVDKAQSEINREKLKSFGISERELEVLQLMAGGFSNQEIANQLFISLNTVKTHAANLYSKLNVKRRTQAITRAREISAK